MAVTQRRVSPRSVSASVSVGTHLDVRPPWLRCQPVRMNREAPPPPPTMRSTHPRSVIQTGSYRVPETFKSGETSGERYSTMPQNAFDVFE